MNDFLFMFIGNLIDPIVALVGLIIGAASSNWWKRVAAVVFATFLMALLVAGIDPISTRPESGVARGFSMLVWMSCGAAIREWRQRRRERAAE